MRRSKHSLDNILNVLTLLNVLLPLPASSQLATSTNTFTGTVAAECSIDLRDWAPLNRSDERLWVNVASTITANSPISLSLSFQKNESPATANPGEVFKISTSNGTVSTSNQGIATDAIQAELLNAESRITIGVEILGAPSFYLPPGYYKYTATLNCLQ